MNEQSHRSVYEVLTMTSEITTRANRANETVNDSA